MAPNATGFIKRGSSVEAINGHESLNDGVEDISSSASREALADNGEFVAVHETFRENYRELISYACSLVDSFEVAQDLVQQAFTNTMASVERGVQIGNMGGFLHRSVYNICINHIRRESSISINEDLYLSVDEELFRITEKSTEASAQEREHWQEVTATVNDLAPNQRYVFLLAEMKGLGCEEIANSMGRSTAAVRQLLSRARRTLRDRIGASSDWVGGTAPLAGMDHVISTTRNSPYNSLSASARSRLADLSSWLGSVIQRGTELLQPSIPVAAGVAAVVLAAPPAPPSLQAGPTMQRSAAVVEVRESEHSISEPSYFAADPLSGPATVVPPAAARMNEPAPNSSRGSTSQIRSPKERVDIGHEDEVENSDPPAGTATQPPVSGPLEVREIPEEDIEAEVYPNPVPFFMRGDRGDDNDDSGDKIILVVEPPPEPVIDGADLTHATPIAPPANPETDTDDTSQGVDTSDSSKDKLEPNSTAPVLPRQSMSTE